MKPTNPTQTAIFQLFAKEHTQSIIYDQQNQQSISIYLQDYQSLLPSRLLTTTAVDLLLKILIQQAQTRIRHSAVSCEQKVVYSEEYVRGIDGFVATLIMNEQEHFILDSLEPLNIFSNNTKYLIVPLNSDNTTGYHWVLALLIREHYGYKMVIFDSGGSDLGMHIGQRFANKLMELHYRWLLKEMTVKMFKASNIMHQQNGYDCGIYTAGFCEYVLKQMVCSLEQNNEGITLDRLKKDFRYLLGAQARTRYREMIQKRLPIPPS